MPDFKNHRPGSVCYVELATDDTEVARSFYCSFFGWEIQDEDAGPLGTYTQYLLDGKVSAAMYKLMPEQTAQGVPPHWGTYFAVDDCDISTDQAEKLGAKIIAGPMDVAEYGRMSIISDPAGATFCIWQSKTKNGVEVRDEANTVCWTELMTTDTAAALDFYGSLFGWEEIEKIKATTGENGAEAVAYHHLGFPGGPPLIGMLPINEAMGPVPPCWSNYFQVEDCAAAEKQAIELGAGSVVSTTPIPAMGFFCVLTDPTGAAFGLFSSVAE